MNHESTVRSQITPHAIPTSGNTRSVPAKVDLSVYSVNTKIMHATYGKGVILRIEKKRDGLHVIEVQFDNGYKSKLNLEVLIRMGLLQLI